VTDPIEQFRAALVRRGIVADEIVADGLLHRCDVEDRRGKSDASYVLHLDGVPAGGFQNWRDGLGWEDWRADVGRGLTPAEEVAQKAAIQAARQKRKDEAASRQKEARAVCAHVWNQAQPASDDHPYLRRKGVRSHGLRVTNGRLVVPLRDASGVLHSLQFIDSEGAKRFKTGGRKRGCFYAIGKPDGVLCLCEGYATAASLYEATGHAVAVAFDAGNLLEVAKALHGKYPALKIVLCSDDDWQTEGNPGLTKAREAAQAVGGVVAVPAFEGERAGGETDFNDAASKHGVEAVRAAILAALTGSPAPEQPAKADSEPKASEKATKGRTRAGAGAAAKESRRAASSSQFRLDVNGVWYFGKDRDGNELDPKWLCGRLEVLAKGRDSCGQGWGLLVALEDADKQEHRLMLPMQHFNGEGLKVIDVLLDSGLPGLVGKDARQLCLSYLQTAQPKARVRTATRTGWHLIEDYRVFVLPGGAIIPSGVTANEWLYEPDGAAAQAFAVKGTAVEWREGVGRLCSGNSRLLFAVSSAFASPLLDIVGAESGGVNFYGGSSSGKTTLLQVAASVCGGRDFLQRWRSTDNALENTCSQYCDALLPLDELAQLDPKKAGDVCYMLSNGVDKARLERTGGTRKRAFWRLLFLSAGEITLHQHMESAGKLTRAGQAIRMTDIFADAGAGYGVFENLHGLPSSAAFAKALYEAVGQYHGAVFRAFLTRLIAENESELVCQVKESQRRFVAQCLTDNASGQVVRVANRFGLIAYAGELATSYGLTGWREGEAIGAAAACFRVWLDGWGGEGSQEGRAMLAQVRAAFDRHGDGSFQLEHRLHDDHAARVLDRFGVCRWIYPDGHTVEAKDVLASEFSKADCLREFFVFPDGWRRICKDFDADAVARLMIARGWMKAGRGRLQDRVSLPVFGRRLVYHVLPGFFEDGAADTEPDAGGEEGCA
jgi:putative DNA primase/helicase